MNHRLSSRKFVVAVLSIVSVVVLAFYDKMTGDVAGVLVAVNVGYHTANAWVTGRGASPQSVG